VLHDQNGRILLQQRAASKTRFASRWSNTCCGHPAPGENIFTAASARLSAELGLRPDQIPELAEAGVLTYRAVDPKNGRIEHEWDHVLTGSLRECELQPDPAEVLRYTWVGPVAELREAITVKPEIYTPWLEPVLRVASLRVSGTRLADTFASIHRHPASPA
jgi:isopentenyl-diphosphate delta-isomerase